MQYITNNRTRGRADLIQIYQDSNLHMSIFLIIIFLITMMMRVTMMRMIMIMLMATMSCRYVAAALCPRQEDQNNAGSCSPTPPPSEGKICEDPHVVGFDGKAFEIWNAGDYLVLRESDGFEVWITISYRTGFKVPAPFITELRCRGPGGPWMKVSTLPGSKHITTNGAIEATVSVDGVGAIDNGGKYTDPTTTLQVTKGLSGSSIEFVAPRWQVYVQHRIAHVIQDGWHYLNMEVKITSMLETPVTGVLGATYHPETYWQKLQEANDSSHGVVDHSSSRALKGTMPHGLLIHPADDDEGVKSTLLRLRKLLLTETCCGEQPYDSSQSVCCNGVVAPKFIGDTQCCGQNSYATSQSVCCNGVVATKFIGDTQCCGQNSYATSQSVCCNGVVATKFGTTTGCCGQISFDSSQSLCCGGVVSRFFFPNPRCCGQTAISTRNKCCPGNIIKSINQSC
jgi:hypothetical protein